MKKKFVVTQTLTAVMAAVLIFAGCKKESSEALSASEEEQAATYFSESETETEIAFDDVFDNVLGANDDVGTGGTGVFGRIADTPQTGRESNTDSLPSCVTVTVTPVQPGVYPKTVTINFGAGCFSHGHLRSGKIQTVYTGRLIAAGSSATTTFDNYRIDSVQVEGTHKITNTTGTTAGANQRQFTIDVTDAKLTKPNGNYTEWNSHRVRTQTEGNGTVAPADDIFKLTGAAHGKIKRGNYIYLWDSEITEPIIKMVSCSWISKGRVRVIRVGLAANSPWVGILDYGAGSCDNQATATINGVVHQITLH